MLNMKTYPSLVGLLAVASLMDVRRQVERKKIQKGTKSRTNH